jgi:hypothetical protein
VAPTIVEPTFALIISSGTGTVIVPAAVSKVA